MKQKIDFFSTSDSIEKGTTEIFLISICMGLCIAVAWVVISLHMATL